MTIREAAERRRQHKAAGGISVDSPYYDADASHRWPYSRLLDADAAELADAYLAEHPADEDQAIDEAWLEACGCVEYGNFRDVKWFRLPNDKYGVTVQAAATNGPKRWNWLLTVRSVPLKSDPTRGDLRRLAAALGITIRETEK